MQLKKIIAFFCLVTVCMQVLPVKQLGAVLFNNQITEEIAHTDNAGKHTAKNEADHFLPSYFNYPVQESAKPNAHSTHITFALVQLHFAEVPTPPPNLM